MKKITKKHFFFFVVFVVVLGSLGSAGYFYWQYQQVKNNPDIVSKEEVKIVTQAIRKFMELPSEEEPNLATVTDKDKLKDQDFFKNAMNGDKVLIYAKAQKAILYRPSTNRVIEFAPLSIGNNQPVEATQSAVLVAPITVAVYNGSSIVGLSSDVENKLKNLSEVKVTTKESAQKRDYQKTLVVDVAGTNKELAIKVAKLLDGEVGPMPEGEKVPESGILVIAAK